MTMLCEDIVVGYKSLGSQDSQMYCGARQTSQGSQYAYTPCYDDDTVPLHNAPIKQNVFRRSVNVGRFPDINTDWNDDSTMDFSNTIEFASMAQIGESKDEHEDKDEDEDDIDNYISSNTIRKNIDINNFAYSTPGKMQMMRSISKK
jgi:hypothetical protein